MSEFVPDSHTGRTGDSTSWNCSGLRRMSSWWECCRRHLCMCLRLQSTLKVCCSDLMNKPLLSTTEQEHTRNRTGKTTTGREGRGQRRMSELRSHILKGQVRTVQFVLKKQKNSENRVSSGWRNKIQIIINTNLLMQRWSPPSLRVPLHSPGVMASAYLCLAWKEGMDPCCSITFHLLWDLAVVEL